MSRPHFKVARPFPSRPATAQPSTQHARSLYSKMAWKAPSHAAHVPANAAMTAHVSSVLPLPPPPPPPSASSVPPAVAAPPAPTAPRRSRWQPKLPEPTPFAMDQSLPPYAASSRVAPPPFHPLVPHPPRTPPLATRSTPHALSQVRSSGFFHPSRQSTPAAAAGGSASTTASDPLLAGPAPISPTYASNTSDAHNWSVPRPVSPVYASEEASATPVPSHVQLRYDHSQIVMRDPTNQRARDESKHIRSCIKHDKKARLLEEAMHQRTQATFGQRKRLHMFDGGCGSGGIIYYAFEAGIHVLVGCDVSGNRVHEARHMYEKMSKDTRSDRSSLVRKRQRNGTADRSMCVGFQHADAFSDETHAHVSVMGPYDIISYFNTLHYAASSLDALRCQFAFWESHLTATGSVIIQTVDSDVLIRRLHQEWTRQHTTFSEQDRASFCAPIPLVLSNRFYRIEWPAHQSLEAIHTGLPYTFSFLASMDATTEYVMMAADLEQLASEHGLVCTQDQNVLASLTASSASLATRDEEQVVELYRTYVLRRCSLPALLA